MEEVLYGLQICSSYCVLWIVVFGNVGSAWWGWSSRSPMVVFCVANAMLHQQRVLRRGVVAWPRWHYDGFSLSIDELLVTKMWKLSTTSLMCKAVRIDDGERLSLLKSPCRSLVTRVVQADVLAVCQMFVS